MAKILFFVLPLPSHINIHAVLARTLRERGHDVVFGVMKDAQARLEAYGLTCVPLFEDRLPAGLMQEWLTGEITRNTLGDRLRFLLNERKKIIDHEKFVQYLIRGGYREVVDAISALAPDLILVDIGLHTYWALMARMTGVPCVYTSALLPLTEDPEIPPLNSLLFPAKSQQEKVQVQRAWRSYFNSRWLRARIMNLARIPDPIANFRKLARVTGCPSSSFNARSLMFPQLDFPVMVTCPEEFEFPEALGRPNMHYVEALINTDRPEPAFPWERLESGKKLVFCSLGSVAYDRRFFQNVLDATRQEPEWQLVMNVGPAISPPDFRDVPANAIIVNGAPQLSLLRRASVMINHGGINSVRECVYFGVPQLAIPVFFDQQGAAARVRYHGLGIVESFADLSSERLRQQVTRLLSEPGFRARSQTMSEAFQRREAQHEAAAFVEQCLSLRSPNYRQIAPDWRCTLRGDFALTVVRGREILSYIDKQNGSAGMNNETEDSTNYLVVMNHEEQYSIWPDYKDVPAGWRPTGFSGPKQSCLAHIEEVWTDMRPLSLRRAMDGAGA